MNHQGLKKARYAKLAFLLLLLGTPHCTHVRKGDPKPDILSIRRLEDQIAAQKFQIETLQTELREVRQSLQKSQAPRSPSGLPALKTEKLRPKPDVDGLLEGELESPTSAASEPASAPAKVIADSRHEFLTMYQQGSDHLKRKEFDDAASKFKKFLELAPGHVYADRAEYLLSEAYFRSGEYQLAIASIDRLENRFPRSFRMPEALYQKALALEKLGQRLSAKVTLRSLLERYPKEAVAPAARQKLSELSRRLPRTSPPPLMN